MAARMLRIDYKTMLSKVKAHGSRARQKGEAIDEKTN